MHDVSELTVDNAPSAAAEGIRIDERVYVVCDLRGRRRQVTCSRRGNNSHRRRRTATTAELELQPTPSTSWIHTSTTTTRYTTTTWGHGTVINSKTHGDFNPGATDRWRPHLPLIKLLPLIQSIIPTMPPACRPLYYHR
jgi:hypothetical protein